MEGSDVDNHDRIDFTGFRDARKAMFSLRLFCPLCVSSSFFLSKIPTLFSERNGFHFFLRKGQILASLNLDDEALAGNC